MASDLDELVQLLDQWSIQTSGGSFVKTESVRRWVEERQRQAIENAEQPRPRTMVQAKRMAARDEEIFPSRQAPAFQEGGASIPASEPHATNVAGT